MRKGTLSIFIALTMVISVFYGFVLAGSVQSLDSGAIAIKVSRPNENEDRVKYEDLTKTGEFTENMGQWKGDVRFIGTTSFGDVGLFDDGIYMNFILEHEVTDETESSEGCTSTRGHVIKVSFPGSEMPHPIGVDRRQGVKNWMIGNEEEWHLEVCTYNGVVYRNIYPGIDLKYRFDPRDGLKYDLILQPYADASKIMIKMEGHRSLRIDDGALIVDVNGETELKDTGLSVFYADDMDETIDASFRLISQDTYTFALENYDRSRPIVIDPLYYSTMIGGGYYDYGYDVSVDDNGYAYLIGRTQYSSTYTNRYGEFPTTTGAYQTSRGGTSYDGFITKFNKYGTNIVYSTFIGGWASDYPYAGAVDSNGNPLIAGYTYYSSSGNFPTTSGAYQTRFKYNSYPEVFVARLNNSGSSLDFGTYIGGAYYDYAYGLEVDSHGNPCVVGRTAYSTSYSPRYGDFPTTSGSFQSTRPQTSSTEYDGFAAKFTNDGSSLIFSTFLAGGASDYAYGVAFDGDDDTYVVGYTDYDSTNLFPTTSGAYQTTITNTYEDAFCVKLNSAGAAIYSTLIGGGYYDYGTAIAVDENENAVIAGRTDYSSSYSSTDYPTTSGSYQSSRPGTGTSDYDIFVTKINNLGTGLVWSTFLGGSYDDYIYYDSLEIGPGGYVYVAGYTRSTDFPTANAYQNSMAYSSYYDYFVTNLSANGTSIGFSTYLGGGYSDYGYGLDVDYKNVAYVCGYTQYSSTYSSTYGEFPTTLGAYQTSRKGTYHEATVSKIGSIDADGSGPVLGTDNSDTVAYTGQGFDLSLSSVTDDMGVKSVHVEYWFGSGTHTNHTFTSGPPYDLTITIPSTLDTVYYFFSASDYAGHWAKGSIVSLVPIDMSAPTFSNFVYSPTPTTGGYTVLSIDVSDNVAYVPSSVKVYYRDVNDASYTSGTMTNVVGDTFSFNVTCDSDWVYLYYYFEATDTSSNVGSSTPAYIHVVDEEAPTFKSDNSDTTATTGDIFTFSIVMNDNVGIGHAYVEYWFGSGTHSSITLTGTGYGYGADVTGTGTITIPSTSLDSLNYFYSFYDFDGNEWTSGPSSTATVPVTDNDHPVVVWTQPWTATTGDPFLFQIGVNDNIDGPHVPEVHVVYKQGNSPETNISLSYNATDQLWYSTQFNMNLYSVAPITYNISAADAAGNWMLETGFSVRVDDNDAPYFTSDLTSNAGTTGDLHNFTVDAVDNIGVSSVYLSYAYQNGDSFSMIPMTQGTGDNWFVVLNLQHTISPLFYNFTAIDEAMNEYTSADKQINITDNDLPEIFSDMSPGSAEAGQEDYSFRVMVTDNIAVQTVEVTYWFSFDPTEHVLTMSQLSGDIYYVMIDLPPSSGTMYYKFKAVDIFMHEFTLDTGMHVDILDNTAPELGAPAYPGTAYTGDTFTISVDATDDVEVDFVRLFYYFGEDIPGAVPFMDGTPSGSTYTFELNIPDSLAALHFWIEAVDLVGNKGISPVFDVDVMDNDDPAFLDFLSDHEAYTGEDFLFKVNATDNIEVDHVDVTYALMGMDPVTQTLERNMTSFCAILTIPNDASGYMSFFFTVYDTSGNSVVSGETFNVSVIDDEGPVAVLEGPDTARQHQEVTFSAEMSSDNVGIVSYTWEINGEPFSGPVVNYVFDDVGEYTITLLISDGTNPGVEVSRNITITDADAPVIVLDVPTVLGNHLPFVANASASTDNVGITMYLWTLILPDNTVVNGNGPVFTFDLEGALGNMSLYLTVMDAEGNKAETSAYIDIIDMLPPTAVGPGNLEMMEGETATFTDMGSTDNVGVVDWVWAVHGPDGTETHVGSSLTYFFEKPGEYNITLTVYDSAGNNDTTFFIVTVDEKTGDFDGDHDGIPDSWEEEYGLDPEVNDRDRDFDGDLLSNYLEYKIGTDPWDPDTDNDGLPDNYEYDHRDVMDPLVPGDDQKDPDGDGDPNIEEYLEGPAVRDPTVSDAKKEEKDNTTLYIILIIVAVIVVLIVMVGLIMVLGKGRGIDEDFPESEYPHLYKKE